MTMNKFNRLFWVLSAALTFSAGAHAAGSCTAGSTISDAVVDCGGAEIGLSCDGDSDKQPPVLILKNATVKNVTISAKGGSDGIHCAGGTCNLINVTWKEVCEDAASVIADNAKMVVSGGSATNTNSNTASLGGKPDKFFQVNNKGTSLTVKDNFTAIIAKGNLSASAGKLARTCGNCTTNIGPRTIVVNNVTTKGALLTVVGVNSSYLDANKKTVSGVYDTATITNLKVEGYKLSGTDSKPVICEEFTGVPKSLGIESPSLKQKWNTKSCVVKTSDVKAL